MKEVTYEDWQKNPTPREMWVWDSVNGEDKKKLKVIHISEETYPVVSVKLDGRQVERFMHCAEIEKQRRMTNKELSRWLRENPTRECKWKNKDCSQSDYVYNNHVYLERCADEEVDSNTVIREDGSEWREPLVEIGE